MAHGDTTRMEYRIRIRTSLGNIRTEWRTDAAQAEALRDRFDVVSIERVERVLDF